MTYPEMPAGAIVRLTCQADVLAALRGLAPGHMIAVTGDILFDDPACKGDTFYIRKQSPHA
jgi:hypothetical protein